jgi:hypothetical protein
MGTGKRTWFAIGRCHPSSPIEKERIWGRDNQNSETLWTPMAISWKETTSVGKSQLNNRFNDSFCQDQTCRVSFLPKGEGLEENLAQKMNSKSACDFPP